MPIIKDITKILIIDKKIKQRTTGRPKKLEESVNISRSCLYEYINELKTYGAEIIYDRKNETFLYKNDFNIEFKVRIEDKTIISNDKLINIFGGKNKKSTESFLLDEDMIFLNCHFI